MAEINSYQLYLKLKPFLRIPWSGRNDNRHEMELFWVSKKKESYVSPTYLQFCNHYKLPLAKLTAAEEQFCEVDNGKNK